MYVYYYSFLAYFSAEIGDYNPISHPHGYVSEFRFIQHQVIKWVWFALIITFLIMKMHVTVRTSVHVHVKTQSSTCTCNCNNTCVIISYPIIFILRTLILRSEWLPFIITSEANRPPTQSSVFSDMLSS